MRFYYFGPWDDPQGALERYLAQRDDLHAGRTPRPDPEGLTVRELVNRFLTTRKQALQTGALTVRSFRDYHRVCGRVVEAFGRERAVSDLRAEDFERLRAVVVHVRQWLFGEAGDDEKTWPDELKLQRASHAAMARRNGAGGGLFCDEAWVSIADKLGLSPRQMEVARYVSVDQSDREIARTLGLSRSTVHTHVERLREKLDVHSRVRRIGDRSRCSPRRSIRRRWNSCSRSKPGSR